MGLVQDLAEKKFGSFVLWIVEKFCRCVSLDNLAEIHKKNPMGDAFGKPHFVRHPAHGHAFPG